MVVQSEDSPMSLIKQLWFAIVVGAGVLQAVHASELPMLDRCPRQSTYVCTLPIYALYGDISQFHGRLVSVAGFLRRIDGDYLLFPDQESSMHPVAEQAILLVKEDSENAANMDKSNLAYVRIVGKVLEEQGPSYWGAIEVKRPPQPIPSR